MRIFLVFLMSFSLLFGEIEESKSSYTDYEELHDYSGLITLGLLGATILTIPNEELHEKFGMASAIGMGVTSTFGFMAHKDEVFDLSEGLKAEHWHTILGTIATIAIIASVSQAPEHSHASLGMLGGITAGASFIIVKW